MAPPPKMNFSSGFLPDTGSLDENKLDDSLRSFMDKGESAFENEAGRNEVIEGVRKTLLAKMRDENKASLDEANAMEEKHIRYTNETMLPIIAKAKRAKRSADIAYASFLVAKSRTGAAEADAAAVEIDAIVDAARSEKDAVAYKLLFNELYSGNSAGVNAPGVVAPDMNAPENNAPGGNAADINLAADNGAENVAGNAAPADAQNDAGEADVETVESVTERSIDLNRLVDLQNQIHINRDNPRGGIMRALTFTGLRLKSARSKVDKAGFEAARAHESILECSERWSEIRSRYREESFKKRYTQYDKLAASYYRFTRQLEGKDERTIDQVSAELGGGSASKQIAEYTGVYDGAQIDGIVNNIATKPYAPAPELRRVRNKALGADSVNKEDANRPLKYHRAIVMLAFADGVSNITEESEQKKKRVRMKLLNNFKGYRARNQFGETAMTDSGKSAEERGKKNARENRGMAASEMNLFADERGRNGAYLTSEKSAKIYEARTKTFGGQTVKGFYFNGEFISADYRVMKDQSQSSYFRSPNWNKVAEEEQVRAAIRRSDFFYHVNAGTIQHYMSYNPDDDFGVEKARAKIEAAGNLPGSGALSALGFLDAYLDPSSDVAKRLGCGHNELTLEQLSASALGSMQHGDLNSSRQLAIMLLSEDDPKLWDIAKEMAVRMGGRFAARLKGIPQSGEVMRMTLLTEISNDRSFDWSDLLSNTRPDRLNMHIEDLSARRDGFFSLTNLRQSFWDGSLFGAITGSFSTATTLTKGNFSGDINKVCNNFNKDYASMAADLSTNFGLAVAPIPAIVVATTGGLDEAGKISDEGQTTMSVFGTVQGALGFVENIAKIIETVKKLKKSRQAGESIRPHVMKLFDLAIKLLTGIMDIVSYWLDNTPAKFVAGIFGSIKSIFNIAKNVIEIIRTNREINKITSSDNLIETALTEFKDQAGKAPAGSGPVNERSLNDRKAKMGYAATQNSQAQYFLSLAKSRARKDRKMAISGVVTNSINTVAGALGTGGTLADYLNPIALPFKIAGKVSSFIGWCVGKMHDSDDFYANIKQMLGEESFGDYAGFDDALSRETGIRNKHYLVDLARIFMAIDTHHLVRKNDKTEGEEALAITLMSPYLDMLGNGEDRYDLVTNRIANRDRVTQVKFSKLLSAVGGPSNWRAVLRASITR